MNINTYVDNRSANFGGNIGNMGQTGGSINWNTGGGTSADDKTKQKEREFSREDDLKLNGKKMSNINIIIIF